MPKKDEVKPAVAQEFNYRICPETGRKMFDVRILERGKWETISTNQTHARSA